MERLAAVVATANADAGGIDELRDVVGVNTINKERGESAPVRLLLRRGAENTHTVNGMQAGEEMAGEFSLQA